MVEKHVKILIIEDEHNMAKSISRMLVREKNAEGIDFLYDLKEKKIELPVIVITGKGDEMVASRMIHYKQRCPICPNQLGIIRNHNISG